MLPMRTYLERNSRSVGTNGRSRLDRASDSEPQRVWLEARSLILLFIETIRLEKVEEGMENLGR